MMPPPLSSPRPRRIQRRRVARVRFMRRMMMTHVLELLLFLPCHQTSRRNQVIHQEAASSAWTNPGQTANFPGISL
jgi:hypothetical protein